jgi:hypothetical protein
MALLVTGIEYHGRLARRDGRPANPGTYDLRFALHSDERIKRSCWTEDHTSVVVAPGGFFTVVLGLTKPIKAEYFSTGPRWASVRIVRRGELEGETGPRVPVLGGVVCLEQHTRRVVSRLSRLEEIATESARGPQALEMQETIEALHTRLGQLEDGRLDQVETLLRELSLRVKALDGDGRRMELLEERVDELDGPSGEIQELSERLDNLGATELGVGAGAVAGVGASAEPENDNELETRILRLEQATAELGGRLETLLILIESESMAEATWDLPAASATDLDVTAT